MTRREVLYAILSLSLLFAALAFAGLAFYFYWVYWWYDVLMHFLAGVIGGLATYWVIFRSGHFLSRKETSLYVKLVIPAFAFLVVAIVWEVLEYLTGTAFPQGNYFFDTMSDIVVGLMGVKLAILICERYKRHG